MQDTLLITVDSLRADHVGYMGYERDTTPTIDSLAEEGASFSNAFAHACSTRPSFPSILTSAYATMYGGYERVSEEQTLVAEIFDNAGFETAGFHSNLYIGAQFGYDRGFDTFYDSKTDPTPVARLRQFVKDKFPSDSIIYQTLKRAFFFTERRVGTNVGSAYVAADEITDRAIEWVDQTSTDSPHFLWVHYMDVHHPYIPPEAYQTKFRSDPISKRQAVQLRRKMLEEPSSVTEEELSDIIDLYDAEIRFTDKHIGRLLSHVRKSWDEVNTLITADHGEEFNDHGRFSHHATFYDEVIHVPFVLDDNQHKGAFDELVGLIDVAPTLVDSAGLSVPNIFHGESIQQLFNGHWDREAIIGDWEANSSGVERHAYRSHNWKFIKDGDHEELFDLQTDPNEKENVVDEHPDLVADFRESIEDHRAEVEQTETDIGNVEMEEDVKERLRQLGYKE